MFAGNDVMFVGNDVMFVGNDVMFVGNDVMFADGEVRFVRHQVMLVADDVTFPVGKVWFAGRQDHWPNLTPRRNGAKAQVKFNLLIPFASLVLGVLALNVFRRSTNFVTGAAIPFV